ncbi:MAG: Uma2 family endonuclease [Gemmataceae bacterium]
MAPILADTRKTTADLLAMPDDGVERWLIDGQIREVGMTIRNKLHTRVESRVSYHLERWLEGQPAPRGSVHAGEVGVRLRQDPDTTVGVDVVYLDPRGAAANAGNDDSTILVGVPTLAVEILSPSTTHEVIRGKTRLYHAVGVSQVWIIDPDLRTVTIPRAGRPPVLLNEEDELDGGPELPGFRVPVAKLFDV